ncbi:1-deoxy-D-xylulose-5-phosphate synthase [Streptomyces sp. NPDC127068]|uniref:1-deoxy-D-xylulose-5-phosphate synthase n=1 Tax=Streptomyces sp. NPDC127068 TaxID=3347127 RepID=UPI00364B50F9
MTITPLPEPAAGGDLLDTLDGPESLRALTIPQLAILADEIRRFLVEKVTATGGHLGPNLGVVELTLALHRVFDSPRDALIFDIGHQAYVHKLLTGRRSGFDGLRQAGGLSGYPSRTESAHDWVENSHASTALSYADGLARARHLNGDGDHAVVAVIGDGALAGGMALEALNDLGTTQELPVVIVLNDNGRSYAPTVGALAAHLAALMKRRGESATVRNLFTELGLAYEGPVDGHDIHALERVLHRARALRRPVVVHALTVKGKGYQPAETDEADCLHAVSPAPRLASPGTASAPRRPSWTAVFGQSLLELADERSDIVALTAAMLRPTGLHPMALKYPDRVLDVGIAEQHTVTSAAGLAMGGLHPVVAVYATFLNRAFDQILMDVALHRLPVTFVLDRAGVTGPDGPSHHGVWDLALLATVPGLKLAIPRDAAQLRELLADAVRHEGPTALRFPRGTTEPDLVAVERVGTVDVLLRSDDGDVLLAVAGPLCRQAVEAGRDLIRRGIGCTVADLRWALPVDPQVLELAARHRLVVTLEDAVRTGGIGTAVAQAIADAGLTTPVRTLGLPHRFTAHGERADLLASTGLNAQGITLAVLRARAGHPHDSSWTPSP